MSSRTIELTQRLYDYLLGASLREPEVLQQLREETASMTGAGMQISPEQGQFMALLVELTGARKTLEIGTFTGYSSLAVARALPPGGKVYACDVSKEYTKVARKYWAKAGVADKVELRLGPAVGTVKALIAEGHAGSFDFAFIDADKENYDAYYEAALTLLKPGGLITIDNVLWNGRVADPAKNDPDTAAIRALNAKLRDDPRVTISMVPIGDGLMLARKRN
ncbi:MAG: class I SAM-dependent methyltransferase [Proteobacteria bacterium]|nr:class I SAM-dependent methyltransferase [Pseudomonadota bacterium]MBI3495926.1 class I SAM-dependent methyltransferase [Pseudomonadota bacterium]